MKLVLVTGSLLLCIKFFAYFLTHSNAILTDALESIVNVIAGSFALYSMYYALKPKDEDHPYGHGKIEFLSAGFEGGMITLAGVAMVAKGIVAFFKKDEIASADIGAYLSAFTGLVNYVMGSYLVKNGKKYHSDLMIADGKHLISDTLSSIGLVAGLIVIYFTGINWIDYVLTIAFGAFISYTGIKLVKESITNLLDKADQSKLNHLIEVLNKNRSPKWIDMHNLRVLKYGSHLHVDCHITLPWYYTLEESHNEVSAVEKLVKQNTQQEIELFIHADPCLPVSCPICTLSTCPVRKAPFVKQLEWNIDNMLPDKKHTA
ncbi:MAG: cation diffusion facilitator family transporter [Bacteroidia bacterium]